MLRGDGPDVDPATQHARIERVDRRHVHEPEPPDRVVHRIEAAKQNERIAAGGTMAAGQPGGLVHRLGHGAVTLGLGQRGPSEDDHRREDQRPARLDRGRQQMLDGDDLEPAREVEAPAELSFVDQRVEHGDGLSRPAGCRSRWTGIRG